MTRIYGSTKSQERRSWGEGGTHKRQKPQERGGGESGTKGATETPGERGGRTDQDNVSQMVRRVRKLFRSISVQRALVSPFANRQQIFLQLQLR